MAQYINEKKAVGGFVVCKNSIAPTGRIVFSVYEPSSYFGPHSTLFTIGNQVHGSVTSRRLPGAIDAIPVRVNGEWNQARFDAIDAWRKQVREECYAAIVAAFPEAVEGARQEGEICVSV
jgi:hypothetical protein